MSDYRTEECPVVDSATGSIDYGPPSPRDVPLLMSSLVAWRNSDEAARLPGPVRAGVLAYQFVTIHPFADGNGRTARALGTWELWTSGYRMRGFLSVEEEYHRDLPRYYGSLQMGLPSNYYSGRNNPDLTPWLSYFVETMATAAVRVRDRALRLRHAAPPDPPAWEELTRPQQQLLMRLLLAGMDRNTEECPTFTPHDVAEWFGVSPATARQWLDEWRCQRLIVPASGHEQVRRWALREELATLVAGAISATRGGPIAQVQTGHTELDRS
ncbi:MAG TPA: Fic family protein [Armatimonadota bacterium]|nr:Fic family protein [Armatimonadota bacterium]